MNVYLKKYKDVLEVYYAKQKSLTAEIESNNARFVPAVAETENRKVRAEKVKTYEEAVSLIESIFGEVKKSIACLAFPNPKDLTDDRLLLECGLNLTKNDIQGLLDRYRDNYTMTKLISDWVQKQKRPDDFGILNFYTPEDKLLVYKKFGERALYTIDGIYNGHRDHFIPLEIEHFADETMNANELKMIGTGEELAKHSDNVPEHQLHIYDDVQLNTNQNVSLVHYSDNSVSQAYNRL